MPLRCEGVRGWALQVRGGSSARTDRKVECVGPHTFISIMSCGLDAPVEGVGVASSIRHNRL